MGRYDGTFSGNNSGNYFKAHKKSFGRLGWIKRWGSWKLFGNGGNDTLIGGAKNDQIYGGSGNDYLKGEDGNDYISGGSGNDAIYGGTGSDYIDGGTGGDRMYGGTGNDTFIVNSSYDRVIEYGGQGIDKVRSSISYSLGRYVENLTLTGSAYRGSGNSYGNRIWGNNYRNALYGGAGNDFLYGYGSNDSLLGGSGGDYLSGGTGNDSLVGNSGNDRLNGYGGRTYEYDTLTGDNSSSKPGRYDYYDGADTFILGDRTKAFYKGKGYATITDFNRGEGDKILLHGSRSNYSLSNVNYRGSSALDKGIFYKGDLIGVVQDNINVFSSDLQFA